jgi:hypothetical protein
VTRVVLVPALVAAMFGGVAGFARSAEAQRTPGWALEVPERVELVAGTTGTSGTLPITLSVDRGQSISKDAGIIIDLAPDSAIAIKRKRLGRGDAVDPGADSPRFSVALRSDNAGDFTMRVRVRFWLCGTRVCKPIDTRRNVAVAVTAPAPAPAAPAPPAAGAP